MGFSDLSMLIFVSERSVRKAGIIHFRQKESDVTLFSLKLVVDRDLTQSRQR